MKFRMPKRLLSSAAALCLALALLPGPAAPARAAAPVTLTVTFHDDAGGGASLDDNPMRTAVLGAVADLQTAGSITTTGEIVKIELTGSAERITEWNRYYLLDILIDGGSGTEWGSLRTLDLTGMAGLREIRGTDSSWSTSRGGELLLPDGLTTLGDYALYGCTGLTLPALPAGLTAIGYRAFASCTGLASLTLPAGLQAIGDQAFASCTGLASLTLPVGLQAIGSRAFEGCTSLASLTLPVGLQSIGDRAFANCSGLASLTLPDGLQSIGDAAFSNCTSLASLTLPDGLQSIGDAAFAGCTSLASLTLPDGLQSIGESAFSNCTSLGAVRFRGPDAPALGNRFVFDNTSPALTLWVPADGRGYLGASASPEWQSLAGRVRTYSAAPAWTPAPSAYRLNVEQGEGGGWYRADSQIALKAVPPAAGAVFLRWELTEGAGEFADPASPETGFTMSIGDAAVRAVFELPAPDDPREQPTTPPQTGDNGPFALPMLALAGLCGLAALWLRRRSRAK